MKKIIIFPAMFFLAVMLVMASSCGKKQDTGNVQNQADTTKKDIGKKDGVNGDTSVEKIETGQYLTVGYIYWVPPAILDEHWSAVILGEIASLDNAKKRSGDSAKNEVFGIIKIDKVLHSEPTPDANMRDQKFIKTDALKGFKPGDKVIVYFVKYEKTYAIKRDNVKKITGPDDELVGLTQRYINNSQDSVKILEDLKEYKMWGKYDVGTASRMMQAYEEKTKGK
jgi:hypothetical protein